MRVTSTYLFPPPLCLSFCQRETIRNCKRGTVFPRYFSAPERWSHDGTTRMESVHATTFPPGVNLDAKHGRESKGRLNL